MPTDTNSGDFEKMQEQAIKRVQEMKQKANPQKPPQDSKQGENNAQSKNPRTPIISRLNEQRRREIPRQQAQQNTQQNTQQSAPQNSQYKQQENNQKSAAAENHKALSSLFNLDNDMSMLLPLLLLLRKEGADELMIMALLYIMS